MSSLTSIYLEYGLGYTILSAFYFVQAILSIQFSKHLERGTQGGGGGRRGHHRNTATSQKKLTNTASPQEKSTKHRHHRTPLEVRSQQHRKLTFYSPHQKNHQHRNTANPHVPPPPPPPHQIFEKKILLRHQILPILDRMHILILSFNYHVP